MFVYTHDRQIPYRLDSAAKMMSEVLVQDSQSAAVSCRSDGKSGLGTSCYVGHSSDVSITSDSSARPNIISFLILSSRFWFCFWFRGFVLLVFNFEKWNTIIG